MGINISLPQSPSHKYVLYNHENLGWPLKLKGIRDWAGPMSMRLIMSFIWWLLIGLQLNIKYMLRIGTVGVQFVTNSKAEGALNLSQNQRGEHWICHVWNTKSALHQAINKVAHNSSKNMKTLHVNAHIPMKINEGEIFDQQPPPPPLLCHTIVFISSGTNTTETNFKPLSHFLPF